MHRQHIRCNPGDTRTVSQFQHLFMLTLYKLKFFTGKGQNVVELLVRRLVLRNARMPSVAKRRMDIVNFGFPSIFSINQC